MNRCCNESSAHLRDGNEIRNVETEVQDSLIREEPLYDTAFRERSMNGHRPRHDGRVGKIDWPLEQSLLQVW